MLLTAYFLWGIFALLLLLFLRNPFRDLAIDSTRLLDTLLIKEKEKVDFERLLQKNLTKAVISLGRFTLFLIFVGLINILVYYFLSDFNLDDNLYILPFFMGNTTAYFGIIKLYRIKNSYNYFSRIFHQIVLENYNLGRALLHKQIKNVTKNDESKALLISGLARSGTTAITNMLHETGVFVSLDYSNMPFLLYPRLWKKFYNPKSKKSIQRQHKDGIEINLNSVEALEEYFFKVLKSDSYIGKSALELHHISVEEYNVYKDYRQSIAGNKVYLAKNNNHILRLKSLISNDTAKQLCCIIMYRDPLEHAISLWNQHQKFLKAQAEDPFMVNYMQWLGHHEFGVTHLPFRFNNDSREVSKLSPDVVEYWVERWMQYYEYVLTLDGVLFLAYEEFLKDPTAVLTSISNLTGYGFKLRNINDFKRPYELKVEKEPLNISLAREIYNIIIKDSKNIIGYE